MTDNPNVEIGDTIRILSTPQNHPDAVGLIVEVIDIPDAELFPEATHITGRARGDSMCWPVARWELAPEPPSVTHSEPITGIST